ncbi:sensor histidine kinase [Noviherbaspirillum sp. ST9]|uniref:sensor histidine kinase n=1 Tax=Noviherbaspirillum sp. ST9 TaxID=3401606 RepID=UPI003B58AF27
MFRDLSFRYKIPLRGSALIICTALVVTASLMFRAYEDLKRDLLLNADSMARVLAHTLTPAILHDDVWRTYEIINSPFQISAKANINQADEILVLDTKQQVYVSTHPKQYPMLSDPARVNPEHAQLQQKIVDYRGSKPTAIEPSNSGKFYMIAPIVSDGVPLGTLVMGYSNSMFLPRFYDIARRAMAITLLALAALLPISWYWGWRMAAPLTQLAGYMDEVGAALPDDSKLQLYESRDEIGQVGTAFKRMVGELKEKEALERQIFLSERLAAVGRLAAGIAHEINNPLGGMLNAISTFKKRDNHDPQTQKTMSLLERGLLQIKDTIAALLVEAKFKSHPLTVQDIEDTRTLVLPDAHQRCVELNWENDVLDTLPLPSTLVRQILINLLLNAMQAVTEHGHIRCHIYRNSDTLTLSVENDGKHITGEQLDTLFEPFTTSRESGHGLGLWMTYQIVHQLKGEIAVQSQPGETRFIVTLPIPESFT